MSVIVKSARPLRARSSGLWMSAGLGALILAGALAPSRAFAGCTPGTFSGATEVCSGVDTAISDIFSTPTQVVLLQGETVTSGGVFLRNNGGTLTVTEQNVSGPTPGQPIVNTIGGPGIQLSGTSVSLTTLAGAAVTNGVAIFASGSITATTGDSLANGLLADSDNGPIQVVTNGSIGSAAAPAAYFGISVRNDLAGLGVPVLGGAPISALANANIIANYDGVFVDNFGSGAAVAATGSGVQAAPLIVRVTQGFGAVGLTAISAGGPASVTTGAWNNISVGVEHSNQNTGLDAQSSAAADVGGNPSASVTVGGNNAITVLGANSYGVIASVQKNGGTGSVAIVIGDGLNLTVTGTRETAVGGFTRDPYSVVPGGYAPLYSGTGGVSITVGKGSITVNDTGPAPSDPLHLETAGVAAVSGGGAVTIDDSSTISVNSLASFPTRGILAETIGSGTALINARAAIVANNGGGIFGSTQNGALTINTSDSVTAGADNGVEAESANGAINIATTGAGAMITSTGAAGVAVNAVSSGSGAITISNGAALSAVNGTGISAQTATGSVSITSAGAIGSAVAPAGQYGVFASVTGSTGAGDVDVNVSGGSVFGVNGAVVVLNAGLGGINVDTSHGTALSASSFGSFIGGDGGVGIQAWNTNQSATGNVNVHLAGAINAIGTGIWTWNAGSGGVTVVTDVGSAITGGDSALAAILANAQSGPINITTNAAIGSQASPYRGNGIEALTNTGSSDISVQINASIYTSGGFGFLGLEDVGADNLGAGNSIITTSSGTSASPLTLSARAWALSDNSAQGMAIITTGSWNHIVTGLNGAFGENGGAVSASSSAAANTGGAPSVQVSIGANNTISQSGDEGMGVAAFNQFYHGAGGVEVNTANGLNLTVTGNRGIGIAGYTINPGIPSSLYNQPGAVSITTGAGSITVAPSLSAIAYNYFPYASGITAWSGGGAVSIDNSATVSVTGGANDPTVGLLAQTNGSGAALINSRAPVVSNNGEGVVAITVDGAATANVSANVMAAADSAAVHVETQGSGSATISVIGAATTITATGSANAVYAHSYSGAASVSNAGALTGSGAFGDGVAIVSATAGSVTNSATGVISALADNTGDAAVRSWNHGLVTVSNSGLITTEQAGHTGFAIGLDGGGAAILNNLSGGVIDGLVATTSGHVTLNNAGLWRVNGAEGFGPGAGAASNVVNNTGLVQVGVATAGAPVTTTTLSDLGAFNNGSAGATGEVSLIGGSIGNVLNIAAPFTGVAGHSVVTLRADLLAGTADQLHLTGGSAGLTSLRVVNTLTGGLQFAAPIVLVTGATAGTFSLDPASTNYSIEHGGVIDQGLIFRPLTFSGGVYALDAAQPDTRARQLPTVLTGAQGVWYSTSPWLNRQADLRDALAYDKSAADKTGFWMKAVGDWSNRQQTRSYVSGGTTYSFNTSYDQTTTAIVGGFDMLRNHGAAQYWVFGLTGGYIGSDQRFKALGDHVSFSGGMVGAYATYLNGGVYVDTTLKANRLTAKFNAPGLGLGASNADVNSLGVQLDAGDRHVLGASGVTLEPLGTLAYVRTTMGALSLAGGSVHFADADSFKASVGLRLNGDVGSSEQIKVKASATARVWDEFEADNRSTLTGFGPDAAVADKFNGAYGDISTGLNVFDTKGRASGFLTVGYKFKSGFNDTGVTAGFRYQW
jgi:hypothetical protein